ncbi:MAG: Pyridoxine 5'-phosphate synthase [Elusimicrobia bacterium ADurb.Bin231]|nr:MAG: Pyridoxine 5'-phosphate synthase [Elusimicrobia bacterium ADurb.Bin231]
MVKLGVNIDHIASIRNLRLGKLPSPVQAAEIVESAGAAGITVHLREDRRHINDGDVITLRKSVKTKLNLEMSVAPDIVQFALNILPDDVCFVPEKRRELTTEGGLDLRSDMSRMRKIIGKLKSKNVRVSVFIDPVADQIRAAKDIDADFVELHTGKYAESFTAGSYKRELKRLTDAAGLALSLGLGLNAGHGLDYNNVCPIAAINGMNELNIGYSIICDAVFAGLFESVVKMKKLIENPGKY